jgi:membrane dipeptidase
MIDLAHVSWETMDQVFDVSDAPLIFTHSGANSVNAHPRNVPDHILDRIGTGAGKKDAVM